MAASQHTEHYDLPIYLGADTLNVLNNFNSAMRQIDAALWQNKQSNDNTNSSLDTALAHLETVNTQISQINTTLEQYNVPKIKTDLAKVTGDVKQIQAQLENADLTTIGDILNNLKNGIKPFTTETHCNAFLQGDILTVNIYEFACSNTGNKASSTVQYPENGLSNTSPRNIPNDIATCAGNYFKLPENNKYYQLGHSVVKTTINSIIELYAMPMSIMFDGTTTHLCASAYDETNLGKIISQSISFRMVTLNN